MKILQSVLILFLSISIFGCAFEENRGIEEKLTESVNKFHSLFNQEKFEQIYSNADDELKKEFTEQQFVSYLEVVKNNDVEELKEISRVWLQDDLKDGIKRIFSKRQNFHMLNLFQMTKQFFEKNLNGI